MEDKQKEYKAYCKQADEKALAAHVVAYRHLGMQKDLAICCMEELAERKLNGSEFDFEKYIVEKLKEMPTIKNQNILTNLFKIKI